MAEETMHMNETLPSPTAHLARAVIECADTRPVTAREAIYNTQGMKVLDKGSAIHAGLYDRLMAHQLSRPLEDSLAIEGMVDGRTIGWHTLSETLAHIACDMRGLCATRLVSCNVCTRHLSK